MIKKVYSADLVEADEASLALPPLRVVLTVVTHSAGHVPRGLTPPSQNQYIRAQVSRGMTPQSNNQYIR